MNNAYSPVSQQFALRRLEQAPRSTAEEKRDEQLMNAMGRKLRAEVNDDGIPYDFSCNLLVFVFLDGRWSWVRAEKAANTHESNQSESRLKAPREKVKNFSLKLPLLSLLFTMYLEERLYSIFQPQIWK